LRTHQLNARDKGIELIQDVDPELPLVLGNYDLLLQVLNNLLGNSLKFTQAGGKVAIRAYAISTQRDRHVPPDQVRVEISDTGIGIDPEDQDAIFDRFFRVENRVHTLEGTGLGLSIVRNIIAKHNSRVHLISEVGVGTTFWFDLAVFQRDPPQTSEAASNASLRTSSPTNPPHADAIPLSTLPNSSEVKAL